MTTKKSTAIQTVPSDEQLALMQSEFPQEQGFVRNQLPRIEFVSQDQTEEVKNKTTGKKEIKLITEAGTFFIARETEEEDPETKKKIWERTEIGTEIEATIVYRRKQLKYYDKGAEQWTSSPVFDDENEILPLFCNKSEVARGTPAELKAREEFIVEENGKKKSKLEENRLLYVLYEGELYVLNLRGTSMYAFMTYARKTTPPAQLTKFSSEPRENGSTKWNCMTFETVRPLNADEVETIIEKMTEIKQGVAEEKSFYASKNAESAAADEALKKF